MSAKSAKTAGLSSALKSMQPEQLIEIILQQQQVLEELRAEIARMKGQQATDSKRHRSRRLRT